MLFQLECGFWGPRPSLVEAVEVYLLILLPPSFFTHTVLDDLLEPHIGKIIQFPLLLARVPFI